MENIILNALKRFRFLGIVFLFTYSYQINAQCGTPVVGCPGTDFGNFGYNSNNNSATIEYDNFVSTFHSTVVRDADGNFQVWGENVGHHATNVNSFSNLLDPLVINTTNFPGFTGTPLKAALGSVKGDNVQGILLTTTGLHVWGRPGVVVATSLTTNWRMQPITVGGNTNGLPTGVTPAMVKMMFVTGRTIAITTCDGDAYVLSQNATLNQGGSSTAWTRVQDSSNNNLTGVVALRGSAGVMFALKSDNTLWTWGINTYLGDGSAFVATRNRAKQMTAPITGINIKMIGATFSGTEPAGYPTYYVLATDGNLYSMGRNNQKQIGDWAGTSTHRTSWVQPRYTSASGQVMNNIKWISPAEHDWGLGAINVITNNADLYNWGSNTSDRYMLGRGTTENVDPGIPNGPLTDDILAVETGGHTTMITMKCTENFGYVGHRVRGSMGNGSGSDVNEQNFTFATAAVQICGAETIPIVNKITINMNSDGTVCQDGAVTLVPDIPGGTYSFYTAVPGSPGYSFYDPADPKRNIADGGIANFSNGTNGTPGDSTNTLTFNGTGTVKVVYSVTGDCGPVEVVTTDFVVIDCVADLEITKSVSPTNANAGDTVTFTINVENLGPRRAKEVQVTELLPAGYTYVNHAVSTGSYNNTTGLWDGFYLIDGNSATLTVTATVNANGPYLNTATVSSGTPDPNLTNNEDTAAVTIPTADLAIEKTVSNATPNVGDTITFTLAVTNNGTANAANVSISDVVPNGYTIGTINNGGVNTAGTIVWSIGNLANGATTTVTFTVTVNATGNYANTATVSSDTPDSDLTNNEDSVTTTPVTPNTTHAVNDINNTYANTSISGSVATNDFDTEGHTQTYTPIDTTDANGNHLVLNSDGTYTFTPGTDFTGTLVYTYTVCDNGTPQACDTATLTIEVLPLPEPGENTVTANNDTATTESGQAVNINVVANDFDMEGDALTVTSNTQPANGTLVNNGDGTFTYTPNTGFTGVDTFTYTICDNVTPTPACDTATVSITVLPDNGENDTYANDDAFNGNQGTVITGNVLTNDVDPEGNTQTVASNTQPANGVVVMNPNTGEFTYTPNDPDFTGTDQFTYTVCDNGTPQACDTATVYITVNPVYIPQADLSIVKIVSNATPNVGDVVTFTLAVTNNGTDNAANVVISDVVPNGYTIGTINNGGVNTAGTITWTIANLANGANTTVTFTTTVNATGSYNNTATVTSDTQDPDTTNNTDTVTVTPANTTIAEDDINNTYVNTPVSGSVATNDKDAEGHTTTYTPIDNTDANGNHLVLNSDGTYTFTPGDNFTGTLVYTYTVCDNGTPQACDTATLTIEVLPLPEPGENTVTANHDTATTEEGQPVAINVVANDFDMESNTFTVTTNTNPTNGTVVNNGDGTFTYTPNPGFEGIDTFTYTICDDQTPAACDTATVTVTVLPDNGENDTYANDDAFNGNQGTVITGNVLTNDVDPEGNTQTVASNTQPANGVVVMNPNTGEFTYTPNDPDFTGTDQFTYTVCDNGTPQACDTATVYITVNPVYIPQADLSIVKIVSNATPNVGDVVTFTLAVTNNGTDNAANVVISDVVPNGYTIGTINNGGVNTAGTITWTIANLANGANTTVTFTTTVNATGSYNNTATVTSDTQDPDTTNNTDTVTVTPANTTIAEDDINNTYVNTPVSGSVATNDKDAEGHTTTYTPIDNTDANGNHLVLNSDGTYTFTPGDNFTGTLVYTYTVCDNGTPQACDTATLTIEVLPLPEPGENTVTANHDTATTEEGQPVAINVVANDFDMESNTFTVTTNTNPTNGTVVNNGDGTFTYTPNPGFEGIDTFTYTICDDQTPAACDTATVTVTVLPDNGENDTYANDDAFNGNQGTPITGSVLTNDTDPEGNIQTVIGNTNPANGTVVMNPEGAFTYTPTNPNFSGTDQFTYTVCDNGTPQACDTATVYITVNPVTPLIELTKDGAYADTNGDGVVNVGDSIVYNFTVTNTGNVTVSNLTIDDAVIGVTGLVVTPSILAPGAVGSATTTYAITQANIDNGGVHNIATANGTDPNNNPVSDNSNDPTPLDPTSPDYDPTCPTCTFTDLQQTPLIELLKDGAYADTNGDGVVNVGDSIVYNFTVTNTGNVTVSNLTIDDAVIGVTGLVVTPSILAPGAVGSATTTYAITQANIDNGGVHNIATANGTDPNNNPVSDNSNDPTPLDPTSPDYDPTCPTCTFTDLQQTPLIELLKDGAYADTNGDGVVNVGDSIVYNFTVTNTGNVTVSNLTIDDAVIGVTGLVVTPSILAPGAVGSATTTYAITQANIDNGGVHNIATANGTDPNNNPVSDNSNDPTPLDPTSPDYDPTCPTCTFTDLQQTPLIELLKDGAYADTNGDGVVNVGDSIVYNFTVTNTGNVTVSNLTIDDAVIGVTGLVVTPSILAPGAVGSATTTYAITQANIDNGGVHNIATANGTDPNNNPVSDNSNDPTPLDPTSPDYDPTCPTCTFTDLQQTPLIELLKDGAYADTNGDGVVNVGDSIVYNFTVTNTGNVTVSNLTIDDAVIGVTGLAVTPSTLAPGQSGTATATYAITQADIDNGGVHNIATANGTDPNNNPVSDNSNDPTPLDPTSPDYDPTCPTCTFTDLQQTPLIELLKDGAYADTNGDGVVNVGDSIVYNFTVTNTGNVTVSNLTIDDAVIGVTGLVVTPSILAPGAVGSATTTYAITQANIDNGGVHNIATANGTDPNNNPVSDNSNDPTPLDPTSPDYDPTCPTCTFTDLQQTPLIELLKDGAYADTNGDGVVNVGDSIVYNFTVTNTGNVTVSNLTIDDAVIGVTGLVVTPSILAPGAVGSATTTYAITQANIDNGGVHNIATANGTDPNNNPVSDNSNDPTPLDPTSPDYDPTCPTCTFTDLQQTPLIELLKDGAYADTNGDGVVNVGDSIVYNFTVTNTGNVTVSNLTIDDAVIGVTGLVVTPSILAPGAVGSATTTYAITQANIDNGGVHNIATANGTDPNNNPVSDNSNDPTPLDPTSPDYDPTCPTCTFTDLQQTPLIELLKDGAYADTNGDGVVNVGDSIVYNFTVTNTGNVTVSNLTIDDAVIGVTGLAVTPSTLAPGQSGTATATYAITQADIDNGGVHNIATANGTDPNNNPVSDNSNDPTPLDPTSPDYDPTCPTCTFTDLQQTPLIELLKDGAYADTNGDGVVNVGDSIVYNFTVTNTGNVTVSNLTIDDAVIGVTGLVVTPSILAPGAVGSATTTYAITQANIDNGGVHNIATANGTDPNNNPVSDNSNDPTPLDPTSPDYDPTCPTCTFTDLQQTPLIELLKDGAYADTNGDGVVNVGDSIVYNFTVTNTGNVTVSNLTIDDAVIGVTGLVVTPSILAPGAVGSATTTYAITQANIDNGGVHNIATANGTDPNNNPVSDNSNDPTPLDPTSPDYDPTCPTCTFTDLQQTPLIELLKDGAYADTNGDGVVNVGDSIVYNFTVTNTGNVTVSNLTIDDAVIGVTGLVVTPSILAPGAVGSATTTYAITQANIDNGGVHNIATANGTDPNNNPVSDNSNDPTPLDPTSPDYDPTCPTCTFTDLQQTPLIELLKDGAYADTNGDGVVNVGDSIVYNFTVTNTGNVTVSNLTIDDAVIGVTGLAVTPSTLAPGQSGTATATYAITQADIDNGGVHNIATANGTDPNNNPVSDNSNDPTPLDPTSPDYDPTCPTCTFTDLQQTPLIELLKDGAYADTNGDGVVNVGDSIVYNFTVTNTGNVTVSNLTIDDAVIGVTGLVVTPSILAPGAVGSATTTYAITQEDIDLGQVLNIAYANGTDPNGDIVFDDSEDPTPFDPNDSTTIVILDQTSAIALVKEGYFNDENGDGYAQPGETITYSFVATNTGNTTLNNVVVVETNFSGAGSTPVPTFVSATFGSPEGTLLVGESATYIAVYIIVGQDLANGSVINEAIVTATDTNDTSVSDTSDDPNDLNNIDADDDGDPDDPTVIELPDGCKIIVNNGVSPNGDGINDYLHIYGLGCYSSNEIEIFNRWGVKVFETKNYENSDINGFKGISNGRTTINQGDGLPTGHYWYVLKYLGFDGKNHSKTGYIYVSQ